MWLSINGRSTPFLIEESLTTFKDVVVLGAKPFAPEQQLDRRSTNMIAAGATNSRIMCSFIMVRRYNLSTHSPRPRVLWWYERLATETCEHGKNRFSPKFYRGITTRYNKISNFSGFPPWQEFYQNFGHRPAVKILHKHSRSGSWNVTKVWAWDEQIRMEHQ